MARSYETGGDRWEVYLGEDAPHPGVLPLIFHCTSNPSHGWRVVEVPDTEYPSEEDVDAIPDDELEALFLRSAPFDYPHDPKAGENTVGDTRLR